MVKRTAFDEMILMKALTFKRMNDVIVDLCLSGAVENQIETKNVCAKVAPQLAEKLDEVCTLLSISKRRFIEAALIDALGRAEVIMHEDVEIFDSQGTTQLVAVETSKGGE